MTLVTVNSIIADLPVYQHLLLAIMWIIAGYVISKCIDGFFKGR